MARVTLTANVTAQLVATTDRDQSGVSIKVLAAATFGSGTLTLLTKPADMQSEDADPALVDTLVAGDQYEYRVGNNTHVYLTLTGATSPSIPVDIAITR